MSKPGFYFYTGDYIKDTRVLTAEARGCYVDWLCILHEKGGSVTWPVSAFGNYCGVSEETARDVLKQIDLTGVADVEWQTITNDNKTEFVIAKLNNRRMVRRAEHEEHNQQHIHTVRSKAGEKGMAKRWQKHSKHNNLPSLLLNPNHSLKKENEEPEPATPAPSAGVASKKLDPRISAVANPIYLSDPVKFRRLIVWIKQAQKYHYSTATIVTALEQFQPRAAGVRDNWWAYLDTLIEKAQKDLNAEDQDARHKKRKAELNELAAMYPAAVDLMR